MRYYQSGDDIYFFGFSRGAYIARSLAELLDCVGKYNGSDCRLISEYWSSTGLLSAGNEELVRFVWKTFQKWQMRQGGSSEKEQKEKDDMFKFMLSFRETFSRPVRRIRFLGLFDTVNSVAKVSHKLFRSCCASTNRNSLRRPGVCSNPFRGRPSLNNLDAVKRRFPYTARSSAKIIRHAVAVS